MNSHVLEHRFVQPWSTQFDSTMILLVGPSLAVHQAQHHLKKVFQPNLRLHCVCALSMLKFVSRMCTVSVWKGHVYSINKQHVVCNMFHVCYKHGNSFTVNKAYSSVTLVPFIEDVTIELICLSKGQRRENKILWWHKVNICKLFSGLSQLHVYIEVQLVTHNKHLVTLVTFSNIQIQILRHKWL